MTEYRYEFHRRHHDAGALLVSVVTVSHWYDDEETMREEARKELAARQDVALLPVYIARGGRFCDEG